jgi:hypothetical protein
MKPVRILLCFREMFTQRSLTPFSAASNDLQDAQVDQAKKLLNAMMTFGVRTSGLTKCASISTQTD